MAFTAAQKSTIFSIFGVPENGACTIITSLSELPPNLAYEWNTTYTVGTMIRCIEKISEHLDDVTVSQQARAEILLARWDIIGVTSPLMISESGCGAKGVIVDYEQERLNIRRALGNLLGVFVPPCGFFEATEQMVDYNCRLQSLSDR